MSEDGTTPGAPDPARPTMPATGAACRAGRPADPGPALMRRLTNAEYQRTVKDLLGVDVSASVATFPADFEAGGFTNAAAPQTISSLHADRYMATAQDAAAQVIGNTTLRAKVVGCDPTTGDRRTCLRSFAQGFGRRAYRRPLQPAELDRLTALGDTETDGNQAAALMLQGVLQSPKFLFRPEVGTADASRPGAMKLTGFEVAARLSYFLVGTTPDDALLDAAAGGQLDTPAGIETVTKRLLADPRTRPTLRTFTDQWFHLDKLGETTRDAKTFPAFSAALMKSMSDEAARLLDDFMWGQNASFLDLYTTSYGYADGKLAAVYKTTAPANASALAKVSFDGSADRGGLLGTAAFLVASSPRGDQTSAIARGRYVREVLLCDALPPPPAEAVAQAMMAAPEPNESRADMEDRLALQGPALCAGCHKFINPIGYGLERYDALGQVRATYPSGRPVRNAGNVSGMPGDPGTAFSGAVELGKLLRASAKGPACVVAKTFRWAFGREEDAEADACTLGQLGDAFRAGNHGYPQLIIGLVGSDAFRYRRSAN
jgi:hypothetical protein